MEDFLAYLQRTRSPFRFALTGEESCDYSQALRILKALKAKDTLADKGYDTEDGLAQIVKMEHEIVISLKSPIVKKYENLIKTFIKNEI